MGLHDVGEIASLFEVNIAAAASIGFVDPLLAQLDLMLFGQFGLGSLQADLTLQFNAAISASAQLNLQVSNPFLPLQAVIAAILQLQAAIEFLLASGLPTVSLQLSRTAFCGGFARSHAVAQVGRHPASSRGSHRAEACGGEILRRSPSQSLRGPRAHLVVRPDAGALLTRQCGDLHRYSLFDGAFWYSSF
jgi:hypothetical protein